MLQVLPFVIYEQVPVSFSTVLIAEEAAAVTVAVEEVMGCESFLVLD